MKPDYTPPLEQEREMILMQRDVPTLRRCGYGWYCMGRGLKIHASTPKAAYDAWEFACMRGYRWAYEQARNDASRVDWLQRGSTGL